MEEEEKIKLMKLSEEDKEKKIKALRKELNKIKKSNDKYKEEFNKMESKIKDTWDIEQKLKVLTHNFMRKDTVLLNSYEIAEIERLVGTYHYYVFVHDTMLRGGIGTKRKIHQEEILCHITDLNLKNQKDLKYKQRGYRRINYFKEE